MSKIIFAGTSEFGIPTLEKLKSSHELVLVITQPDRPTGRNKTLTPPPMKLWAMKNVIEVSQPEKISELENRITNMQADLLLVAAYGQIIPGNILSIPKFGSVNIHGSVLPKYRGASPIQATIFNGDKTGGISLLHMDEKMDHGPLLATQSVELTGKETFPELYASLSEVAATLTEEALANFLGGSLIPRPQNHAEATFTKLLTRNDGRIDWNRTASEIDCHVRAYNPEPGTWTLLKGKVVKILEVEKVMDNKIELPGKLYVHNGELAAKCLDGSVLIRKVKPEGKNEMSGKDFLNGLQSLSDKLFI